MLQTDRDGKNHAKQPGTEFKDVMMWNSKLRLGRIVGWPNLECSYFTLFWFLL